MSSSSSSFGVGGNVGGTMIPLQRELEATAWTQVNKQALGIVRDSIELVFSQTNPRYNSNLMGNQGYRTTAENPLLDHFLEVARAMHSMKDLDDTAWTAKYEELLNDLSPELQENLKEDLKLPFEQRSYSMTALNNVLILSAQFLYNLDKSGSTSDPSTVVAKRTAENILLPFLALQGAITNTVESSVTIRETLEALGHNYPYFEQFSALLGELAFPLEVLQNVSRRIDSNFNGQLPDAAKQEAALAAEIFGKLGSQLDHVNLGGAIGILRDQLKALENVALSLSLPSTTMAPLFLSFALATIGLYTSDSPSGVIGPDLELATAIPNYLFSQAMPNAPRSLSVLLTNITTTTLAIAIGLSSLAVSEGVGIYPARDPSEAATAKFFAFELLLQMGVASNLLDTYYHSLITASGGSESAARTLSPALSQLTQGFMIFSAVRYGHQSIDSLLTQFPHLKEGVAFAQTLLNNDTAGSDQITALNIAADELLTALENQQPEKIDDILDTLLSRLGSSLERLNNNIDDVRTITRTASIQMGATGDDAVTHIVTVA